MGPPQHTATSSSAARRTGRLGPRTCLRKGCGCVFQPTRWNQRYCPDPECRRLVRRWQAARRQRKHREREENRQRHAQAERSRRERNRQQARQRIKPATSAAEIPENGRAWSRCNDYPEIFCDRPGCYEPRRDSCRAPARYCSDECRQAVRRVLDRERKWLQRNNLADRFGRRPKYGQTHTQRSGGEDRTTNDAGAHHAPSVVNYRADGDRQVSYRAHKEHPP